MPRTLFLATWSFGRKAVQTAWRHWRAHAGNSLTDAIERGVAAVELDPAIESVGRGGLPNCRGVMELDAAWMDGATLAAGGVAALRDHVPAIRVARRVMEQTPHTLLVGAGARQFARAQGFRPRRTLTPAARRAWERWRKNQTRPTGHDTLGLIGWHAGHAMVACATSGLAWKLPGRVGDSPLVGAGLYADDEAGAAVATGLGEEIYRFALSARVVEAMRRGLTARQACVEAVAFMRRRKPATREVQVAVIAVRRDGNVGAAAMRPGFVAYACRDGRTSRVLPAVGKRMG